MNYNPLIYIESVDTQLHKIQIKDINFTIPDNYINNPHAISIKT